MFTETLMYLKDPRLVARIQESFGIGIHSDKENISLENGKIDGANDNDSNLEKATDKGNEYVERQLSELSDETITRRKKESQAPKDFGSTKVQRYTVTNKFWYYLFLLGTELGDENFYSAFIPFWFWNIDGAVGRRVVLVWAIVMTIGQGLKDIICWPRPACPPAARLQSKWSQEYGMPSTHAMIGVAIPFSVVLFTMNRYIYSFSIGFTIATLWCILVFMSRLYLGMHTVLDIVAGLALAILMMVPLVPLVDFTDHYFVTETWALTLLITLSILTIVYYPRSDKWTPTRGDTAMVVSVTTGVHVGAWLNYQTGAMVAPYLPPPYKIIWPTYTMLGYTIVRTILGFGCVLASKAICKSLIYVSMCAILGIDSKGLIKSEHSLENKNKTLVDLVYKYVSCFMIGFNTVYLLPKLFIMLGIERPTFYTEM